MNPKDCTWFMPLGTGMRGGKLQVLDKGFELEQSLRSDKLVTDFIWEG
jgi:hypothetical protein